MTMRAEPLRNVIRLRANADLGFRPGQTVILAVVKHLIGDKWAVSHHGRVFPAVTELPLQAGQRIRALVGVDGGRTVLHVQSGPDTQAALARQMGLPADMLTRAAVEALMRQGQPVAAAAQVRHLLWRDSRPPRKLARTLAILQDKGISLDAAGLQDLLSLVLFGEDGDPDRRERERPGSRDLADRLREILGRRDSGSALSLYNALPGREEWWIAVPIDLRGSHGISGTLRLLIGSRDRQLRRIVVDVRGRRPWSVLLERGPQWRLRVFAQDRRSARTAGRAITALGAKLRNHGIRIDDSISDVSLLDGYSADEEEPGYRVIDTLG